MSRWFLILIYGLVILSCRKESELVDPPLQSFLETFQQEAATRGIKVDYHADPVEARLQLHEGNVRLGWCNYNSNAPDIVVINTLFWDILDDLEKEKLVFHELGHCILKRQHLDSVQDDGRCKSIMHSGQKCSDNYSSETRSHYLDELFLRR